MTLIEEIKKSPEIASYWMQFENVVESIFKLIKKDKFSSHTVTTQNDCLEISRDYIINCYLPENNYSPLLDNP